MLVDFYDIKQALNPIVDGYLDHWHLNDSTHLTNPTSEELARWVYNKLLPFLPDLHAVVIEETCTSACTYSQKE